MFIIFVLLLSFVVVGSGWRAVPANTAMFASQASRIGISTPKEHLKLPRTYLHSVYKFGYCAKDVLIPNYLRKRVNVTFKSWRDAKRSHFVYLVEDKHTQVFFRQCIVMRVYVPLQYLFFRGRIPMYYCQGQILLVILETYKKYEIHEFYTQVIIGILAHFEFEFYHPYWYTGAGHSIMPPGKNW